ncbi:MAG: hypothetical protein MUP80_16445 [Acidobacteriia bacterium]|nr:hypothetical protein [Terriglobia bacterium]
MTEAKVMLAVFAVDGWIHAELAAHLIQSFLTQSRAATLTFITGNRPVAHARNHAAGEFLNTDCEWLVMVDHDTVPPANFLEIVPMMEADGKFIAGLPYPFMPGCEGAYPYPAFALGWFEAPGKLRASNSLPSGWSTGYDFLGGGSLIVHRSVFERVSKPYFKTIIDDAEVRDIDTEMLPDSAAEDLYFTWKAKGAGFELWTHSDFVCNHYKTIPLLAVMGMLQSVSTPDPALV